MVRLKAYTPATAAERIRESLKNVKYGNTSHREVLPQHGKRG